MDRMILLSLIHFQIQADFSFTIPSCVSREEKYGLYYGVKSSPESRFAISWKTLSLVRLDHGITTPVGIPG